MNSFNTMLRTAANIFIDPEWDEPRGRHDLPQFEVLRRFLDIDQSSGHASRQPSTDANKAEARRRAGVYSTDLRLIGQGARSAVFEVPGTLNALKKGSNTSAIWNDFRLTKRIHDTIQYAMTNDRHMFWHSYEDWEVPKIPQCYDFYRHDHEFISQTNHRFPESHRGAESMFLMDRILPIPEEARDALIELYFEKGDAAQSLAKEDPDNADCLLRVYLGECEPEERPGELYDSLRNFPLRLNIIEDIGLNTVDPATSMAIGLAFLHWEFQLDAKGVQFVLGCSPHGLDKESYRDDDYTQLEEPPHEVIAPADHIIATQIWMLGFDEMSTFISTKEDVTTKLVPAFLDNNPYFPRPNVENSPWRTFREEYVQTSKQLSCNGDYDVVGLLSEFFCDEIERVLKENRW